MIAVPNFFSPDEYLRVEQDAKIRHEYRYGLVYAMAGGSDNHNRLTINLLTEINLHLRDRDRDCQFFGSDVKVNYAEDFYYYPDAFVTCDPRDRHDRYIKRYPKLVAEVLSPSTKKFDVNDKFADYQKIDTLEEYVLIAQHQPWVEIRRRTPAGTWQTVEYGVGDRVEFCSIGLEVAIEDLYRGVSFDS